MKGGTTTGWGGREAVEKVKNTNEPKFEQAGVEISKKRSQNEPKLRPQAGDAPLTSILSPKGRGDAKGRIPQTLRLRSGQALGIRPYDPVETQINIATASGGGRVRASRYFSVVLRMTGSGSIWDMA